VSHCTPSPASQDGASPATARPERSSVVPPYWQRHERGASRLSSYSNDVGARILLEDHTDEGSDQCKVLWARSVVVDDYVVVSGTAPGLGAYVVWNCTVETLDVSLPGAASDLRGPHIGLVQSFLCSQSRCWAYSKQLFVQGACYSPSHAGRTTKHTPLTMSRAAL
jgi:hypothetical protein